MQLQQGLPPRSGSADPLHNAGLVPVLLPRHADFYNVDENLITRYALQTQAPRSFR